MYVLGISCFRDDAAAALIRDGQIEGIAEEERFARIKHAVYIPKQPLVTSLGEHNLPIDFEIRLFPSNAVAHLLREAGIGLQDIDVVAHDFDYSVRTMHIGRFEPFARILEPDELSNMIKTWAHIDRLIAEFASGGSCQLVNVPHHLAHAAGTVFGSGYEDCNFLVMDGLGELASATWGSFSNDSFQELGQVMLPHSLGLAYAAVTAYLGFRPFSEEQKTMGLSAYGSDSFHDQFRKIIRQTETGYETDSDVVWSSLTRMGIDRPSVLSERIGVVPRRAGQSPLESPYPDVASSLQTAVEASIHHLVDIVLRDSPRERLCLAGGVALNCVANGKIVQRPEIKQLFIQPQAGDSGSALGAAYYAYWKLTGKQPSSLTHAAWGPQFTEHEIEATLKNIKVRYERPTDLAAETAELLANGEVVGWFQGRAECGPRALGQRSLFAHPGLAGMRDKINAQIKRREHWRPFAATVLLEDVARYFKSPRPSPFMLLALELTGPGKHDLHEASHVDGTTRPQVLEPGSNEPVERLICAFKRLTGIGALLNTSFNLRDEPLVNTPGEAVTDFFRSGIDSLAIGPFLVRKH